MTLEKIGNSFFQVFINDTEENIQATEELRSTTLVALLFFIGASATNYETKKKSYSTTTVISD
jgi:hypothetical protein